MKSFLAAAGALSMLAAPASAADEAAPDVYTPSGGWAVDYGTDYCRLSRSFSDGRNDLSLAFERIQPTNSVRLILVGDGIRMYRGSDQLTYTLSPSGGERKSMFWSSTTPDHHQYFNLGEIFMAPPLPFGAGPGGPPPGAAPPQPGEPLPIPPYSRSAEQDFAKGVSAIDITGGTIDPVRIETGGLKAPIAALQACADDLAKSWGLDPAQQQGMTRPAQPKSETSKWLPSGTIGFGDFAKLGGSANQFRVMVSAEGKPTACAVHWASLDQKTNDAVCKAIVSKGEFFPALDQDGNPMASYWVVAPFFLMPPFGGT